MAELNESYMGKTGPHRRARVPARRARRHPGRVATGADPRPRPRAGRSRRPAAAARRRRDLPGGGRSDRRRRTPARSTTSSRCCSCTASCTCSATTTPSRPRRRDDARPRARAARGAPLARPGAGRLPPGAGHDRRRFTDADLWMLVIIFLLLIVLVFLSVAEMGLSQMTKPKAASLADEGRKSGKALQRLVEEPERWVNPLLLTVNICQTVQATLTGIVAGRAVRRRRRGRRCACSTCSCSSCSPRRCRRRTRCSTRSAPRCSPPARRCALEPFPPLQLDLARADRADQRDRPRQGPRRRVRSSPSRSCSASSRRPPTTSVIEHEERELIESIIEFGDTVAREVMVPRPDMVTVDHDATVTERARRRDRARLQPPAGARRRRGRRHRRPRVHQGPDARRARGRRRPAGHRLPPRGALRPREQAGQPADARDAGREVPPRDRRRRVRRDRRADHARGLPRGAGRRDRRRARRGGARGGSTSPTATTSSTAGCRIGDLNDLLDVELPDDDWDTARRASSSARSSTCPRRASRSSTSGWRFTIVEMEGRRVRQVRVLARPRRRAGRRRRRRRPLTTSTARGSRRS